MNVEQVRRLTDMIMVGGRRGRGVRMMSREELSWHVLNFQRQ